MLAGAVVALQPGLVRLRVGSREVRIEPRGHAARFAFRTEAFAVTVAKEPAAFDPYALAHVRSAVVAWEQAMSGVVSSLEALPAMRALGGLARFLGGEPLDVLLREACLEPGVGPQGDVPARVRALCERPPDAVSRARHVVVSGAGRSGTRWVMECAARVQALAVPTLLIARPLVGGHDAPGGPDPQSWNRRLARCNAHFPPSSAGAVERALAGVDPIRTTALLCPPGTVMVTKARRPQTVERWSAVYPDVRVVLVRRDPRDVFLSRHHYRRRSRAPRALELPVSLARWLIDVLGPRGSARARGALVLRYEDLRRELEGQLLELARWLDVPAAPGGLASIASDLTFEAMTGRRFGDLRDGEYFRGGSDWTLELSPAERRIAALFDPWLVRLGYPPARRQASRR